jgi:hypothetical protein
MTGAPSTPLAGPCSAAGVLTARQIEAVRRVAALARESGQRQAEILLDGSEAYAYPYAHGIAWGLNDAATGACMARGICHGAARGGTV